jgi:hypothetical protein
VVGCSGALGDPGLGADADAGHVAATTIGGGGPGTTTSSSTSGVGGAGGVASAGGAAPVGGDGGAGGDPADAGAADASGVPDAAAPKPDAGGGKPPPPTAAEILAALGACKQVAGTTKFAKDAGGSKTVPLCQLTNVIWFSADMDIDCDGGQGAACKADPYYQSSTSGTTSTGKALDASTLPFYVLPIASNGFTPSAHGIHIGQVAAVIYKGKLAYAIYGDAGPKGVVGEGSYALAKALGIPPSPVSGGVDSGVTYVIFTGADGNVTKNEDHAEAVAIGQKRAADLVAP